MEVSTAEILLWNGNRCYPGFDKCNACWSIALPLDLNVFWNKLKCIAFTKTSITSIGKY